jgi:hypothetical protein
MDKRDKWINMERAIKIKEEHIHDPSSPKRCTCPACKGLNDFLDEKEARLNLGIRTGRG